MFNIPAVTKNLLIINVVAYMATMVWPELSDIGGLHFFLAADFSIFQLFSYMFLHAGFTHIFFNMFALWMFGRVIESVWGPRKFLFYYISCGVGAGLMQEMAQFFQFYFLIHGQDPTVGMADMFMIGQSLSTQLNAWTTVGASGAVYSILLAFGMIFPNERIFIFPLPVPIKAKWFVAFYAVLELVMAVGASGDGVAHMAHLGGMLFGFLMIRYWDKRNTGGYSRTGAWDVFDRMKRNFDRHRGSTDRTDRQRRPEPKETDWEYNARKKENQEEIDRILDKIRKSGYDSLTKEEKQKLFDSSND